MGWGSTNVDAVGLEEAAYIALDESFVKVTSESFWESAGVNEESPECINNACARGVL
jgi:hypothetical protein